MQWRLRSSASNVVGEQRAVGTHELGITGSVETWRVGLPYACETANPALPFVIAAVRLLALTGAPQEGSSIKQDTDVESFSASSGTRASVLKMLWVPSHPPASIVGRTATSTAPFL